MVITLPVMEHLEYSLQHNVTTNGLFISIDNMYVPLNSLVTGTVIKKGDDKCFIYQKHSPISTRNSGRVSSFCEEIKEIYPEYFLLSNVGYQSEDRYISGFHSIYKRNTIVRPILTLAIRSVTMFSHPTRTIPSNKITVLLDKQLIHGTELDVKLYRNLNKVLLTDFADSDLVFTDNIDNLCYNASSTLPRFSTVNEMVQYTKDLNLLLNHANS